jgi:hypothetical protein
MRVSPMLTAMLLCAASIGAAHAQTVTPGFGRSTGESSRNSSGMSFAYDAQHGQINANGIQLNPTTIKSNSVSPTTGTITVVINIKVLSHFEGGTTYHCSVNAIGGILDIFNGTVDGGIETANGFATVTSGGTASCTLVMPYSWTLPQDPRGSTGLILAFGAAAVNPQSEVQRSTLQVDGIENLPASGAASKFTFNVAL